MAFQHIPEMVELSFWGSEELPKAYTQTLSLSTVQIVRDQTISCIQLFADSRMYIRKLPYNIIHDENKPNLWTTITNYWIHFLCNSEKKKKNIVQMSRAHLKENITIYLHNSYLTMDTLLKSKLQTASASSFFCVFFHFWRNKRW